MNVENHPESITDHLLNVLTSPLCSAIGGRLDEVFTAPREKQQQILNNIVAEEKNKLNQITQVSY